MYTYHGLMSVENSVLNVKALAGTFNQALIGAFSVVLKSSRTFVSSSSAGHKQQEDRFDHDGD